MRQFDVSVRSIDHPCGQRAPGGARYSSEAKDIDARLRDPLEPWFDKTWRPDEIKLAKFDVYTNPDAREIATRDGKSSHPPHSHLIP